MTNPTSNLVTDLRESAHPSNVPPGKSLPIWTTNEGLFWKAADEIEQLRKQLEESITDRDRLRDTNQAALERAQAEIERLRAGWQWLAESADPNKLTGLFVVAHAKRMLSGDSPSAPETSSPFGATPQEIFNAGVTHAKYRMHYKAALEWIAGTNGKEASSPRQVAQDALDSSPEETSRDPFPMLILWLDGPGYMTMAIVHEIPKGHAFRVIAKNLRLEETQPQPTLEERVSRGWERAMATVRGEPMPPLLSDPSANRFHHQGSQSGETEPQLTIPGSDTPTTGTSVVDAGTQPEKASAKPTGLECGYCGSHSIIEVEIDQSENGSENP